MAASILPCSPPTIIAMHPSSLPALLSRLRSCGFICLSLLLGLSGTVLQASNIGKTWRLIAPLPTPSDLNGIVWTGTRLVAVGNGAALTSSNGISWDTVNVGSESCTSVAWSGSLLVAGVQDSGFVLTSADGLSWAKSAINYPGYIQRVIWTGPGGQFVALGMSTNQTTGNPSWQLLTSSNGLSWTAHDIPGLGIYASLNAVIWTGSCYVVAGSSPTYQVPFLASSPDGVTWTNATLGSGAATSLTGLAWTGALAVAVGDAGSIYTSPTGTDPWTAHDDGSAGADSLQMVIWDGTQLVALGYGAVATSSDGSSWTSNTSTAPTLSLNSLVYTGSQYVAVGYAGVTYTSPDATTWTQQTPSGSTNTRQAVVWSGTQFVSVGGGGTVDIETSPDGITWTAQTPPDPNSALNGIAVQGATLVAVGNSGTVISSANGVTWTAASMPPNNSFSLNAVAVTSSLAVVAGGTGYSYQSGTGGIFTSTDLDTWTAASLPVGVGNLNGVTHNGSQWVAVGDNGVILTSPNGTTWTLRASGTYSSLYGVAASSSLIVAVGQGVLLSSPTGNGTTWTDRTPNSGANMSAILWTGTDFIATGYDAITSTDGINWNSNATGVTQNLHGIAWNGTQALAVGDAGVVVMSDSMPSVTTGSSAIAALESDGTVQVRVNLSFASTSSVSVPFTVSGTAIAGTDYTALPTPLTLTFAPGVTSQNITITLNPASLSTSNPTVIISLGTPTGTPGARLGSQTSTTLTIEDTNGLPPVSFGSSALTASESDGTVGVAVQLGWVSTSTVTVPFTLGGTATSGTDYTALPTPLTLTFNPGEQVKSILIPLIDAHIFGGAKTVLVTLGSPTNATLGTTSQFTLTIQDNDVAAGGVGTQWTRRNPQPTADGLNCVAWSPTLHRLVAMGGAGSALTSDDGGLTWTHRITGTNAYPGGVTWGGPAGRQQFVAAGGDGTVLTSADGIAWVQRPLPSNLNQSNVYISKVVWANNLFIAMGNVVFTSRDGIHWSEKGPDMAAGIAKSAVWTGTQFVIVGSISNDYDTVYSPLVFTSPDGTTWTDQSSKAPAGEDLVDVKWTGGQLVALGHNKSAYTSPSGTAWTKRTLGTLGTVSAAVWTGSKLVAVGQVTATSTNGTTWTEKASGVAPVYLNDVAYTGPQFPATQFVAVGGTSTILTSPDGVTWTRRSSGIDTNFSSLSSVAWSGTQFAAVGDAGLIMTSPDGSTWTKRTSPSTKSLNNIAWSGTIFVAAGPQGTLLTSADGITWTSRTSGTTLDLNSVMWSGSQFVTVGGAYGNYNGSGYVPGTSIVLTSPNGITWTKHILPAAVSAVSLNGITYNDTLYVAVGSPSIDASGIATSATVLTSPDAVTWTNQTVTASLDDLADVTWSGTQFVAVGGNGTIIWSSDGVTWQAASYVPLPSNYLASVRWTGSTFIVAGGSGTLLTSPDADVWTAQPTGTSHDLHGLAWNGAVAVAVGQNGFILTSGSGTPPVAPVLTFTTPSIIVHESDGTLIIGLDLSSPPSKKVLVPFTFTGPDLPATTAIRLGATGDIILPGVSPLVFNPGETHLDLVVKIVNDNLVNGNRTGHMTLLTPTVSAATTAAILGTQNTFFLTVLDDDIAVTIPTQPTPLWLPVGGSDFLSVSAGGSGPPTFQWQKAGGNIAGATLPQLQINAAKLTDGASYKVIVKNNVNPLTSNPAEIAVVDTAPHPVVVASGTTATLTANAQGATATGLHYQWYNGAGILSNSGTRITGATTKTLVIKLTTVIDADTYHCTVTSDFQPSSLDTGDYTLTVTTAKPLFVSVADPLAPGTVAVPYVDYIVPVDTDPTDAPSKFTATGLPAGMTIDPVSGTISGTPTLAVTDQKITITASNPSGSTSVPTHLTVNPMDFGIAGTFDGFLGRDALFDTMQGSRFQATVTATGSYTGKIIVGTASYAFAGALTNDGMSYLSTTPLVRAGKPATSLAFTCDPTTSTISITLSGAGASDPVNGITGLAWRNNWSTANPAVNYPGYYTFGIDSPPSPPDPTIIPQGTGYGSCTVPGNGAAFIISGKLADGSAFTTSTFLGPDGQVLLYQPLYTTSAYVGKGGLLGYITIHAGSATPNVDGSVDDLDLLGTSDTLGWYKPAAAAATERNYQAGFDLPALTVAGFVYLKPDAGTLVMGLTLGAINGSLIFNEQDFTTNSDAPNKDVQVLASGAISPFAAGTNPNKVSLTITPTTGAFTGSFTLVEPDPADAAVTITRAVTFNGMIVTDGPTTGGVGWFLLPILPDIVTSPPLLPAQTPIRSGQVQLNPM